MRYEEDHGPPMFTYAIMAALIAFFAAQWKGFDLTKFLAYPWRVADGEVWRLFTCTLLHGGVLHFLFNTVLFFRFSSVIDNWLGPWAAMLFYVLFAASASAAQVLMGTVVMVGASGAVYGLFGFLWVMSRRRDDAANAANMYIAQTLLYWMVICIVVGMMGVPIANTAHVWGFFLGWLLGQTWVARRKRKPWLIAATTLATLVPIALTQRPIWERTLAHVPFLGTSYRLSPPPGHREMYEDPDNQPKPNIFARLAPS